jgi:hypothetical protein
MIVKMGLQITGKINIFNSFISNINNDFYRVNAQFRKMNEAFGATACRLLHINSSNGSDNVNDIWTAFLPKREQFLRRSEDRSNIGKFLSQQDLSYVAALVDEVVTTGIIPSMERKIKHINSTVVSKKKGIRGTFSNWFGTKKKEEIVTGKSQGSAEIQIRRMADYCFMLRDYETALATYKLVSSDFKNNKDLKHYAGTMEFIALCTLFYNQGMLTSQVRKDVESSLDSAFSNYNMVGENRYALRSAFFLAMGCKARGDQRRAAEVFTRASNLEPSNHLLNALLFEQTAFSYLLYQSPKSQTRKFALFLVLAGHRYFLLSGALRTQVQQQQISNTDYGILQTAHHSYRCYKNVLLIHNKKEWAVIFEHMNSVMGDLSLEMSNASNQRLEQLRFLRDSIQYIHDCMGGGVTGANRSSSQGPEEQRQNMKKFLDIVASYMTQCPDQAKALDAPLHLPEINVKDFRVLLNQYGNVPSSISEYPQGEWRSMEESFVRSIRGAFHIFRWDRNSSTHKEPTVVFGKYRLCHILHVTNSLSIEPVFVELSVKNVLFIPVRISKLQLIATFTPAAHETIIEPNDGFKLVPEEVIMKPGQTQLVRLSVIPLMEGELNIQGVTWSLENVIDGVKHFETRGRRLNDNAHHRQNVVYEQDNRLNLKIIGNMPLLNVDMTNKPTELWQGQLHKSKITLKNVGGLGLKNLKVKLSHPQFIAFGRPDQNDSQEETPAIFLQPFSVSELSHEFNGDLSVIDLTPYIDTALTPNEHLELPVYFRGGVVGSYNVKFLFYYEPEVPNHGMKFRLHRLETNIQVTESLHLYHFSQPSCFSSTGNTEEFILGITAANNRRVLPNAPPSLSDHTIQIHQISAISPDWKLTPLNFSPGTVSESMVSLQPAESTTLYFKINKINKNELVQTLGIEKEENLYHGNLFLTDPENAVNSAEYPNIDFLYRDCINLQNTDETHFYEKLSFPFLKQHGLSAVVFWSCNTVRGQSQILNTKFVPEKNTPIQMHSASNLPSSRGPNALCPISVSLHYNDRVVHSFSDITNIADTVLTVPIVFEISNISPDLVSDFSLELLSPDQQQPADKLMVQVPNGPPVASADQSENAPFLWMGSTRLHFSHVKPSQHLRVPVQACFFGPGKYNLNQFRIGWTAEELKEEEPAAQPDLLLRPSKRPTIMSFSPMQYLITIDETNQEGSYQ